MTVSRVLIADALSPRAAELLGADGSIEVDDRRGIDAGELAEVLGGYDALLVRSRTRVTAELLDRAPRLRVVGRAGIGVDNIDIPAATRRGVVVMNAPSGNATTTAEHALAMLLSLARHTPQATASMRAGQWEKKRFGGRQIAGSTVGIVGLGNIGRIVADRLLALNARVVAFDPYISADAASRLGVEKVDLERLLAVSDFVTIHAPLTDSTRHLLDAAAFAAMKPGAAVVHCARGGIVDESALIAALQSGRVSGAAIDVWEQEPPPADHPLLAHPGVIATPHLGASTTEAQEAVAVEIAGTLRAFLDDGTVSNALNTPSVTGEALRLLSPYLGLATQLGRLAGQLHSGTIDAVHLRFHGELAQLDTAPVTAAALAALLETKIGTPTNAVSAPSFARERGIAVEATAAGEHPDFTNLITLSVRGGAGTTVSGAVFGRRNLRVVGLDGYELDMVPSGEVLLVKNDDRPGIIGAVGTALGQHAVNVPRLTVGLKEGSREALEVWSVDAPIPDDLLDDLRATAGIRAVYRLRL